MRREQWTQLSDIRSSRRISRGLKNVFLAKKTILNWLAVFFQTVYFLPNKDKKYIKSLEYPDIIISIGKKSSFYAIYAKIIFPQAKLVFLMPCGEKARKYASLIFYHSYKTLKYKYENYIPIDSAPHLVNSKKLQEAKAGLARASSFSTANFINISRRKARDISLSKQSIYELYKYIKNYFI